MQIPHNSVQDGINRYQKTVQSGDIKYQDARPAYRLSIFALSATPDMGFDRWQNVLHILTRHQLGQFVANISRELDAFILPQRGNQYLFDVAQFQTEFERGVAAFHFGNDRF